jgi:LemA protein
MIGFIIVLIVLALIALWVIKAYNDLIKSREFVRNAMSQISAQIESRWDALKSMIEGTKQYAEYEAKTLENITEKRTSLNSQSTVSEVEQDDSLFDQALGRIFAVAENYPDLKASNLYRDTISNIDKYEQQVRQSRMIYNDSVTKYNRLIQSVPTNIIAGIFNFNSERYFEGTAEKTEMPSWS